MYWAKPLESAESMELMLQSSQTIGLYKLEPESDAPFDGNAHLTPSMVTQIGMARLLTDRVTVAYLTDMYVAPAYQGRGLASWMLSYVKSILLTLPDLRRLLLLTSATGKGRGFYSREMDMKIINTEDDDMICMVYRPHKTVDEDNAHSTLRTVDENNAQSTLRQV